MNPLDPDGLREALSTPFEVHPSLPSTQAHAKARARSGVPHGFAVFAEAQQAGRGRLGRVWEAPAGSAVLMTVVLRPSLPARSAPLLCLAAAVATVEAIGDPLRCGIKWPNDVLANDGRKVAGILAEADPRADGTLAYALIGIGLNVHAAPPLPTATSLQAMGMARDRTELASTLVNAVVAWTDRLAHDATRVLDHWRSHQTTLGRRVRVGEVMGTARALHNDGALEVVDDAGAVHRITAGDVEMVGRP